jgi:ELWxxDGT repeat protein
LEGRRLLSGVVLATDLDLRTESAFPDTGHQIVVAGDVAYGDVAVSRSSSEEELAFSDGTPGGTRIAKQIVPGMAGTHIDEVLPFGNLAIFMTYESNRDTGKLWRSDGTDAGTFPLLDWTPSSGMSSTLLSGAELGGKFYFPIYDQATGQGGLGVTDGTAQGTGVVKWLGSGALDIRAFDGNLYFSARDVAAFNQGTGYELWKSDGTADGTALLKDINAGTGDSSPSQFTPVGSTLYFTANPSSFGLYKTDGTAAGTQLVSSSFSPRAMANFNGTLLFSSGNSIYRVANGGGPGLVKNVGFTVWGLETAGSYAYFVQNGNTYWQTDGTSAGTVRLTSPGGAMFATSADMTALGAKMLFRGSTTLNSNDELWITDGTVAGTALVAELRPGAAGSSPWMMTSNAAGTRAFFAADNGNTGFELWVSDGTAANTHLTADLDLTGVSSHPKGLTKVGNAVYLSPGPNAPVRGLFKTDGTPAGTAYLGPYEIVPTDAGSRATRTVAIGNRFFFAGTGVGTGAAANVGTELYLYDGSPLGTRLVKDLAPGTASSMPEYLTPVGDTLFFLTGTGTSRTLWRTDGTDAGTVQLATGVGVSLAAMGDALYFAKGAELWKAPAAAGAAAELVASGLPTISGMGTVGTQVALWCENGTTADYLYRSDGTPGGTQLVTQLPTSFATLRDITDMGGGVAVFGYAGLWRTDLTAAGTTKISTVDLDQQNVAGATVFFHGQLFFKGTEPTFGRRGLWKTDGTASGTTLVSNASGDFVEELTVADGRIFFRGYGDGAGGTGSYGVWQSNGTPNGTRRTPGQPADQWLGFPASLTELNGSLLFVADDRGLAGEEVFKVLPDAPEPLPAWVAPGSAAKWNSATRTLSVTGAATIVADPGAGQPPAEQPLVVADGPGAALTIAPAPATSQVTVAGLWLASGATATLADAPAGRVLIVTASGLSIAGGSALDLTDNDMIVRGGTELAVRDFAAAGFAGGTWSGPGLRSTAAATDAGHLTTLGVAANAQLGRTEFAGVTGLAPGDILVKYTYEGDADLTGAVTLDDFTLFLTGFQHSKSTWFAGDFDYNGRVTLDDFTLFLRGYQGQGAPL